MIKCPNKGRIWYDFLGIVIIFSKLSTVPVTDTYIYIYIKK